MISIAFSAKVGEPLTPQVADDRSAHHGEFVKIGTHLGLECLGDVIDLARDLLELLRHRWRSRGPPPRPSTRRSTR